MKRTSLVLALSLFFVPLAWGDQLSPELEKTAAEIETLIIAPCCWRQPVADHYSESADQIRREIREKLVSGLSREAIVQGYVEQYGERILSKPPASGFGSLAYLLPVLFLAAGACVALVVIRRLRPVAAKEAPEAPSARAVASKYSEQLDKELWG